MRRLFLWYRFRTAVALMMLLSTSLIARATTWEVTMEGDARFHPSVLTIVQGDSVSWHNADAFTHTSTSGPASCVPDQIWDSGDVLSGMTWGRVFRNVGTFEYFCTFHCSVGMTGTITVLQNTAAEVRTWGQIRAIYR